MRYSFQIATVVFICLVALLSLVDRADSVTNINAQPNVHPPQPLPNGNFRLVFRYTGSTPNTENFKVTGLGNLQSAATLQLSARTVTIPVRPNANSEGDVTVTWGPSWSYTFQIDTKPPTLTLTAPAVVQTGAFDIAIAASETINDFTADDIKIAPTGAATATLTATTTPNTWTANIVPADDTEEDLTISVDENAVLDNAGNANAAVSQTVRVDTRPPTFTLAVPDTPQNSTFQIDAQSSEHITRIPGTPGLQISSFFEFNPTGFLSTPVIHSGRTQQSTGLIVASVTPVQGKQGTVTITVTAGHLQDAAGNTNTATSTTVQIDTKPPTFTITPPTTVQNGPFDVTITASETVNGFTADDIQISPVGAVTTKTLTLTTTPNTWRARLTPNSGINRGIINISISANVVLDDTGNANAAVSPTTFYIDTAPPTFTLDVPDTPQNSAFGITLTASEPITLNQAGITFTPEDVVNFSIGGTGNTRTITVTPKDDIENTEVSITLPIGVIQDNVGNQSESSRIDRFWVDTRPPTLTISAPTLTIGGRTFPANGPFDIEITASEPVTGLTVNAITLTPAGLATVTSLSGSGAAYTATLTPSVEKGSVEVLINAGIATDRAGNTNTASGSRTFTIDSVSPRVEITAVPEGVQLQAFTVTLVFSEAVSGFPPANIVERLLSESTAVVAEAVITPESSSTYILEITPDEDTEGVVSIQIPAGVARDDGNNPNLASDSPTTIAVKPSWIPDDNLRALIRQTLGLAPDEAFSRELLANIFSLEGPYLQIIDLTGLEHAVNLAELILNANRIESLGPLAALEELTTLNLADNNIEDITLLENLIFLTQLDLAANRIADLTPLTYLSALSTLNLRENKISDISVLSQLRALTDVDLTSNAIEDVSPLIVLENLKTLRISENPLTDAAQLAGLAETLEIDVAIGSVVPDAALNAAIREELGIPETQHLTRAALGELTSLHAPQNAIVNLTGLENAVNLSVLALEGNAISELTALENLEQLQTLNLSRNAIRDITPLAGLNGLETLDLSGNRIDDIAALTAATALKSLNLNNNPIADLTPLVNLTGIEMLKLRASGMTDVAVISQLTGILALDISGNAIGNITELQALRELTVLDMRNNQLRSLEAIAKMVYLTGLDISGNRISDLSPVAPLTELVVFNARNNAIRNVEPLSALKELRVLTLSENRISTLEAVAVLTKLRRLDVRDNTLKDVTPLGSLRNLERLDLSINNITNIAALGELPRLTRLRLAENPILDTSPLFPLTRRRLPVDIDIPVERYAPYDVNEDGSVNARDTARVTAALGQTDSDIRDPRTDVNADGSVDATDLRLVRENYDTEVVAGAPALAGALPPEETRALPNYPNPLNPETWIPYQLREAGDVKIFIYNTQGILVRRLDIGHQKAGDYTLKRRAAYWDGRNAFGERVASGVYFYTFQADSFTATRKMMIRK